MPNLVATSKFISLILRHDPAKVGITLDKQGWVAIPTLLEALSKHGHPIDETTLLKIVNQDNKKRYAVDGGKIRANQGHSIPVDLGLKPEAPPNTLYHGTQASNSLSIMYNGLLPGSRNHVHLSTDLTTAVAVGKRRGPDIIIFVVDAKKMHDDGFVFMKSENDVWLCEHVPPVYIKPY